MAETHAVSETPFEAMEGAAAAPAGTLFISARSLHPCGVEIFTRALASELATCAGDARYELLPVSGRWRDLPSLLRRVARARRVVFSFPLVAWKRTLLIPIVLLLAAFVTRRRIGVILHEWAALHRLRRLVLIPFVVLSETILVLSPYIRDQIAHDPWIAHAVRKCRLIPHPPTVRRPQLLRVTETVRRVEEAARSCDIVIGHFGSIYQGKAATALLDVCAHLRSRGIRALIVFAGGFTQSLDGYELQFHERVRDLAIGDQVIVTGYIDSEDELYALFERIGVFLFHFPEGLTARRSSVIACLQSRRPVVVSTPQSMDEFLHHDGLTALIEAGALSFVARTASTAEIADELLAVVRRETGCMSTIDCDAWWGATTAATREAL